MSTSKEKFLADYLTISQLSVRLGRISRQRTYQLMDQYEVTRERIGNGVFVHRSEAEKIPRSRPKGRPKK